MAHISETLTDILKGLQDCELIFVSLVFNNNTLVFVHQIYYKENLIRREYTWWSYHSHTISYRQQKDGKHMINLYITEYLSFVQYLVLG